MRISFPRMMEQNLRRHLPEEVFPMLEILNPAILGRVLGFTRGDRRRSVPDRRQRSLPVSRDRRTEIADRRGSAYAGA